MAYRISLTALPQESHDEESEDDDDDDDDDDEAVLDSGAPETIESPVPPPPAPAAIPAKRQSSPFAAQRPQQGAHTSDPIYSKYRQGLRKIQHHPRNEPVRSPLHTRAVPSCGPPFFTPVHIP